MLQRGRGARSEQFFRAGSIGEVAGTRKSLPRWLRSEQDRVDALDRPAGAIDCGHANPESFHSGRDWEPILAICCFRRFGGSDHLARRGEELELHACGLA